MKLENADEFVRMLGKVIDNLSDDVADVSDTMAGDVIDAARRRAAGDRQAAMAARALEATGEGVRVTSSSIPGHAAAGTDVFYGAEFGGQRRPTTMQFPPPSALGYFLHPAAESVDLDAAVGDAVDKAFRPWDNGGIL